MRAMFLALLVLPACAGLPKVHGNERGGMIEWFATNEREVFEAASQHCARYSKKPRITSAKTEAGGTVLFECS